MGARITQDQRMGVKVYLLVLNVALLLAVGASAGRKWSGDGRNDYEYNNSNEGSNERTVERKGNNCGTCLMQKQFIQRNMLGLHFTSFKCSQKLNRNYKILRKYRRKISKEKRKFWTSWKI